MLLNLIEEYYLILCVLCGSAMNYIYNAIITINPMIAKII